MRTKTTVLRILIVAATTACAVQSVSAQSSATLDRTRVLRAAADALGLARWSDIGAGATRLPAIDVVNTMEFSGSGTGYGFGQTFKTEYHAALANLAFETEYSGYADHGEILTDIRSPGRIVRKQGGRTVLDIAVKMWEANNPYLVFPVPENVKTAAADSR